MGRTRSPQKERSLQQELPPEEQERVKKILRNRDRRRSLSLADHKYLNGYKWDSWNRSYFNQSLYRHSFRPDRQFKNDQERLVGLHSQCQVASGPATQGWFGIRNMFSKKPRPEGPPKKKAPEAPPISPFQQLSRDWSSDWRAHTQYSFADCIAAKRTRALSECQDFKLKLPKGFGNTLPSDYMTGSGSKKDSKETSKGVGVPKKRKGEEREGAKVLATGYCEDHPHWQDHPGRTDTYKHMRSCYMDHGDYYGDVDPKRQTAPAEWKESGMQKSFSAQGVGMEAMGVHPAITHFIEKKNWEEFREYRGRCKYNRCRLGATL